MHDAVLEQKSDVKKQRADKQDIKEKAKHEAVAAAAQAGGTAS
jgi:hypothetical protein